MTFICENFTLGRDFYAAYSWVALSRNKNNSKTIQSIRLRNYNVIGDK